MIRDYGVKGLWDSGIKGLTLGEVACGWERRGIAYRDEFRFREGQRRWRDLAVAGSHFVGGDGGGGGGGGGFVRVDSV